MALAATVDARQVAPGAGHTTPPRIGSCDHRPRGDGSHPHLPAERRQRGEINELCAGGVRVFCLSPRKRAGPPAPADQTIVRSGGIEGTRCRHCRVRKTDPSVRGKTRSGSRDWLCLCLIWADADPRTMLSLSRLTPRSDWRRHQRALCFLTHVLSSSLGKKGQGFCYAHTSSLLCPFLVHVLRLAKQTLKLSLFTYLSGNFSVEGIYFCGPCTDYQRHTEPGFERPSLCAVFHS